jgi:hypothetical protein
VNAALEFLLDPPLPPPPAPRRPTPPSPTDVTEGADRVYVVDEPPDELLLRLADAGHSVGEVVFVDPYVGILEIVVGVPPAVGQLAVSVGSPSETGTPVSLTLEPLGVTPAPPITEVVGSLMEALRR